MRLVMKFGGTSLANGQRMRHGGHLIQRHSRDHQVVAVGSAMGDTTDRLLEMGADAAAGKWKPVSEAVNALHASHLSAARQAIADGTLRKRIETSIGTLAFELEKVLTGITILREITPRARDLLLSFGERLSNTILAGVLESLGIQAQYFTGGEAGIVTDSNFGEAQPLAEQSAAAIRAQLEPLLSAHAVPVVTGFIGRTEDGEITTLGRGGSDFTATILAAALRAGEVWIWTDVDGLMSADPRLVEEARCLREVSYGEATEMAAFGAKALHPRALDPVRQASIPVRIRNASNPRHPGTLIVARPRVRRGVIVKAVGRLHDAALIGVSGAGMVGKPGTAARIFDILAREGINILMISQSISETNISVIVRRHQVQRAVTALQLALLGRAEIQDVSSEDDVSVIAAIGAGMQGTAGVASRVFTAVARAGVNVRMIAQGSSELSISFVVKERNSLAAVRALHHEFRLAHSLSMG